MKKFAIALVAGLFAVTSTGLFTPEARAADITGVTVASPDICDVLPWWPGC
jgi:hypothetical protein